jgi:hypothetical protein
MKASLYFLRALRAFFALFAFRVSDLTAKAAKEIK